MNPPAAAKRFQVGGKLRAEALYVEREADRVLPKMLREGRLAHVLAPRQSGKSSLASRTAATLAREGIRSAVIDLNTLGTRGLTLDQWCYSLADAVREGLRHKIDLDAWWDARPKLTPLRRLDAFFSDVIAPAGRAVVYLDEIDVLRTPELQSFADDFFAMVRGFGDTQSAVGFCLVGVALARDLMSDAARTPFNTASRIVLGDFTRAEIQDLAAAFGAEITDPDAVLDAIYAWTNGHPYMTHKLAAHLSGRWVGLVGGAAERVESVVRADFLSEGRTQEPVLTYIVDQFKMHQPEARFAEMIGLYERILREGEHRGVQGSEALERLSIAGLVTLEEKDGTLVARVRNRVMREVFDLEWIEGWLGERKFTREVRRWEDSGRKLSLLASGTLLREVQTWADDQTTLTESERAFVEASTREESRRERARVRQRNVTIGVLGVALAGAVVAAVLAVRQYNRAVQSEEKSKKLEHEASANARIARTSAEEARRNERVAIVERVRSNSLAASLAASTGDAPAAFESAIRAVGFLDATQMRSSGNILRNLMSASEALRGIRSISLSGHEAPLTSVRFSPDSQRVATGSEDGSARIWEVRSGTLLRSLNHGGKVLSVTFSPDGAWLATAGDDRTAKVWDVRTGRLRATCSNHRTAVRLVAFTSSNSVITADESGTINFWGQECAYLRVSRQQAHMGRINSLELSNSDSFFVTSSDDGTVKVWNVQDGSIRTTFQRVEGREGHYGRVRFAAFSPNGESVATAGDDGRALMWSVTEGTRTVQFLGHAAWVRSLAFSLDGTFLATASDDNTARIWSATRGVRLETLTGHQGVVVAAKFADENRLVTGSYDMTARVWDVRTGNRLGILRAHTGRILDVAVSNNGFIATASDDRTARIWTTVSPSLTLSVKHGGKVVYASLTTRGDSLMSASDDGTLRIMDLNDGATSVKRQERGNLIRAAIWTQDGQKAFCLIGDNEFHVWNVHQREVTQRIQVGSHVSAFAVSPDSMRIAVTSEDGMVRIWNTNERTRQASFVGSGGDMPSVVYDRNGQRLLIAGQNHASIWNLSDTSVPSVVFVGHEGRVRSANFSFDERYVVTTGDDHTARIWDARSGRSRFVLQGHASPVHAAAFSPDGSYVITASEEGIVKLWRMTDGSLVYTLESPYGDINSIGFSPDNHRVVAATGNYVWTFPVTIESYLHYFCDGFRAHTRWNLPENEDIREICARPGSRHP